MAVSRGRSGLFIARSGVGFDQEVEDKLPRSYGQDPAAAAALP